MAKETIRHRVKALASQYDATAHRCHTDSRTLAFNASLTGSNVYSSNREVMRQDLLATVFRIVYAEMLWALDPEQHERPTEQLADIVKVRRD